MATLALAKKTKTNKIVIAMTNPPDAEIEEHFEGKKH